MKKTLTLAALICCAMTTVFTSCTNDEDNKLKPEAEDNTPVAAVMNYTLSVGDDIIGSFNVTVQYYNAAGELQSEPMTQSEWKKSVKANLPVRLGARLTIQAKEGVNFANIEKFNVSYSYSFSGYAVSATDKVVGNQVSGGTSTSMSMKGDRVSEWSERRADGLVKFLYSFAADGQATSISWE